MDKLTIDEEYDRLIEIKEYWKTEKKNISKKLIDIEKKIQNNLKLQKQLNDYDKLWQKYKKSNTKLTDEEKEKLSQYITEIGFLE